jgi:hypothetical protein
MQNRRADAPPSFPTPDVWGIGVRTALRFSSFGRGEAGGGAFLSHWIRGRKRRYSTHLHRYLAEFDFRYSNRVALGISDVARADRALKGIVGKRLTYETPRK